MRRMYRKRFLAAVMCVIVLTQMVVPVKAASYSYSHRFEGSFVGSATYTAYKSPYIYPCVEPIAYTTSTTYVLRKYNESVDASNYVKTGTPGHYDFTYKSGYGVLNGPYYRMLYYPSFMNFAMYDVAGTWQP